MRISKCIIELFAEERFHSLDSADYLSSVVDLVLLSIVYVTTLTNHFLSHRRKEFPLTVLPLSTLPL